MRPHIRIQDFKVTRFADGNKKVVVAGNNKRTRIEGDVFDLAAAEKVRIAHLKNVCI
jgi:hypothetical protein